MQKIFLSLILLLFVACGGGGNGKTTTSDNNSTSSSQTEIIPLADNSNVTPLYDYNQDKTAIRTLDNSQVNHYEEVEIALEKLKSQQNQDQFNAEIDKFVSEILTFNRPIDNIPSYAPRGANRSLLVEVKNGQIDYSSYQLKGDVNGDFQVNFKDIELLKTALFESNNETQYDTNDDGQIDIKDVIYATARLNSEIAYFDFYDKQKQRLDIPIHTIKESKTVTYNGNKSSILVVAKDENGASGYTDGGLSDSSLEWYKKDGWQLDNTESSSKSNIIKKSANEMIINSSREVVNIEPDPYLIGWHFSLKYITIGGLDAFDSEQYGIESWRWFFEGEIEPKIKSHFRKTKMNHPITKMFTPMQYIYWVGSQKGKTNEVKAKDFTFKYNYKLDGTRVTLKRIVEATTILFESKADKTFKAVINVPDIIDGKATLKRVGPTPKEESFEGEVKENKIEVNQVPFGAYDIEVETKCGCKIELEKAKVFEEDETTFNLFLAEEKLKAQLLTLIVEDNHGKPLTNKDVKLEAKECLDQGEGENNAYISQSGTTDHVGQVDFEDILIGEYRVIVDGKYIQDIQFCGDDTQIIKLDPLWQLKVNMHDECFAGAVTIKKFSLDCQNGIRHDQLGTLCADITDGVDRRTNNTDVSISYTGDLIASQNLGNGLEFYDSGITITGELNDYCDGGSEAGSYMSSGWVVMAFPGSTQQGMATCNGALPTQALQSINNNKKYSWSNSNHGLTCSFTLEPCKDDECKAY